MLVPYTEMADKHDTDLTFPLEALVDGLAELTVVLGAEAAPVVAGIRETLMAALAARDRGDLPGAVARIGDAMQRLSALADHVDPADAGLMRALAASVRGALLRGDTAEARQRAAVMLEKSGAVERKKPS